MLPIERQGFVKCLAHFFILWVIKATLSLDALRCTILFFECIDSFATIDLVARVSYIILPYAFIVNEILTLPVMMYIEWFRVEDTFSLIRVLGQYEKFELKHN